MPSCRLCAKEFQIYPDDLAFYAHIDVPTPTWCPPCRMLRRQLFRNERSLYRAECGLCGKKVLSMYRPGGGYAAYCNPCYASDGWDPLAYGREYDPARPFFAQLGELFKAIPRRALYQDFAVESEYVNMAVRTKNCYLCFGGRDYEDCQYSAQSFELKDCADVDFSSRSEYCYDSVQLRRCSRVSFSAYSEDCADSSLLFGCRNVHDCIGCVNLRNASYCIFNTQYSRDEYERRKTGLRLDTREGLARATREFRALSLRYPRKYAWARNAVGSTGDGLEQVKECAWCFAAAESERCRYSFFMPTGAKDCYDVDHVGVGASETYELHSGFGVNRVAFGNRIYDSHHVYYSDDCYGSAYLFGCAGLRKKEYCILNRRYSKEEYGRLIAQIRADMENGPFVDPQGRTWKYGEYFPFDLMPFAYNETVAQEYFPLAKEEAVRRGMRWKDAELKTHAPTRSAGELPEIYETPDSISQEIIACAHGGECEDQCSGAFRIIPQELRFLRNAGIPLPQLCPNCRHFERRRALPPLQLFDRTCACHGTRSEGGTYQNTAVHAHGTEPCGAPLKSPFAPEGPEIIYCEACYQMEVA